MLTIVSYIAPVVVPFGALLVDKWWSRRKTYAIEWRSEIRLVFSELFKGIPRRIREQMELSGVHIENLVQYLFVVRNTGREAFDRESIGNPLTWTGCGDIRHAWVDRTDPVSCVDIVLSTCGNVLTVGWERFFNPGCTAEIGVLCDRGAEITVGAVEGQIKNVRRIRIRRSSISKKIGRGVFCAFLGYALYYLVLTLSPIDVGIEASGAPVLMAAVFYVSLVGVTVYARRIGAEIRKRISWRKRT